DEYVEANRGVHRRFPDDVHVRFVGADNVKDSGSGKKEPWLSDRPSPVRQRKGDGKNERRRDQDRLHVSIIMSPAQTPTGSGRFVINSSCSTDPARKKPWRHGHGPTCTARHRSHGWSRA